MTLAAYGSEDIVMQHKNPFRYCPPETFAFLDQYGTRNAKASVNEQI